MSAQTLIDDHQRELESLCRNFHVLKLELFGSATTDDFDPHTSDLDFLVTFGNLPKGSRFTTFFGLQRALASLFQRQVDLVEDGAPRNPYFLRGLNQTRRLIYAA